MNDILLTHETMTRRDFINRVAVAVGLTAVAGSGLRAQSANNKLNIAAIGAGGMGAGNVGKCAGENIVALCDVDFQRAGETFEKFPKARRFKDFRVMLDRMDKEIDAVIIATPDHTHAVATMEALRTEGLLMWDGPNMRVTNNDVANQYVQREYRQGWTL